MPPNRPGFFQLLNTGPTLQILPSVIAAGGAAYNLFQLRTTPESGAAGQAVGKDANGAQ